MVSPRRSSAHRQRQRRSIATLPTSKSMSSPEQGNITADLSSLQSSKRLPPAEKSKKSRSKSLGPGGLDALKDEPGNRQKSTVQPQPKSILKPSLPISPPKAIPSFDASRKRSPGAAAGSKTPQPAPGEGLLIDFSSTPGDNNATVTGAEKLANPFDVLEPSNATARTEEEEEAASREREEKEKREQQRQAIMEQRAARRKSLANRRVSFAPEATLHTWVNMEVAEDSTTSSASTNSTRRASSLTTPATPQVPSSDSSEPPSTPPEQIEDPAPTASPAHQRDLHQKKRRRSSTIPPMNFNNPDNENFSSSPLSGSSAADEDTSHTVPGRETISNSDDSDSGSVGGESTGMSLVSQDDTGGSGQSSSSTSSSARLDEALRQAAAQAGTRGIDFDEHGDVSMEMADEEITASFQPWVKKGKLTPRVVDDLTSMQDQENMNPFSPAIMAGTAKGKHVAQPEEDHEEMSMDVTNAVGGIIKPQSIKPGIASGKEAQAEEKNEEMSMAMDVTKAIGRILKSQSPKAESKGRRKSIHQSRRSSTARRKSGSDVSDGADATMEFTTAVGGIQPKPQPAPSTQSNDDTSFNEDEEMTMELTGLVGGVIQNQKPQIEVPETPDMNSSKESIHSTISDQPMDMTAAIGGILDPIEEQTEPQDNQIAPMDVTHAMGEILPPELNTSTKSQAKQLMEWEADVGQLTSSPFQEKTSPISPPKSTPKAPAPMHLATIASETGSPSLASIKNRASRRSGGRLSATPKLSSHQGTPVKGPSTPTKQMTPIPGRASTPTKTTPLTNVTFRGASPKRLFKTEIKKANGTPKSDENKSLSKKLFQEDVITGQATPSILLRPSRRRSSGLGIDKEGLGSPRVEALFDRRGSLGDETEKFVAEEQTSYGVRFDNPRMMEQEIDAEREEEERRESGRFILEREADIQNDEDKDVTASLKDMIQSMTPKKERSKLRGRKSLAVGTAKGLLGKRPIELDQDEEDPEEDPTPKRLKGREDSPVKNVKLPPPPQDSARTTRAMRKSIAELTGNIAITPTTTPSPTKNNITTPKHDGRFKDAEASSAPEPTPFEEKIEAAEAPLMIDEGQLQQDEERIHLQDFLNMTGIQFMDLSTTKRRHTTGPVSAKKQSTQNGSGVSSVEDCVVAAMCTVPMLELYQHSCRELKKYISKGRRIIRDTENDTYKEQPLLFREYLLAPPDVRMIMDNQFRNVKTHSRLSSKGLWYEWRMKLLEGLREGLDKHVRGMDADDAKLTKEETELRPLIHDLVARREELSELVKILREREDEAHAEDSGEREDTKRRLEEVEASLAERKTYLQQLREEQDTHMVRIANAKEMKDEYEAQVKEVERVREECKGWSAKEVIQAKASAAALTATIGWSIISATPPQALHPSDAEFGTALTLTYRESLCLYFHPEVFARPGIISEAQQRINAPIYLTFSPKDESASLTTERRFFLQFIQGHIHSFSQYTTSTKDLLDFISRAWDTAANVSAEVECLSLLGITGTEILGDDVLGIRLMVMLPPVSLESKHATRVDVAFKLHVSSHGAGSALDLNVKSNAQIMYGDLHNSTGLASKLRTKIKKAGINLGSGVWSKVVQDVVVSNDSKLPTSNIVAPTRQPEQVPPSKFSQSLPRLGNQPPTAAPAARVTKTPGRKVLGGVSNNVPGVPHGPASTTKKSQLQSPVRRVAGSIRNPIRSPAKSSSTGINRTPPIQSRTGPVPRTPPGAAGVDARDFYNNPERMAGSDEVDNGHGYGNDLVDKKKGSPAVMDKEGLGTGSDETDVVMPVEMRRGGIPRTPPMVVRDL